MVKRKARVRGELGDGERIRGSDHGRLKGKELATSLFAMSSSYSSLGALLARVLGSDTEGDKD